MSEITRILTEIESGDSTAAEELLPLVYDELRKLAAAKLAHEPAGQSLAATALVHEAYLRLVEVDKSQHWDSQGHFFSAAAEAMRRILVENARRRSAAKRGGGLQRRSLDEAECGVTTETEQLLELNDALDRLAATDADAARLVELRYFAGLTMEQAAQVLKISSRSAYYMWTYARTWLHRELTDA